VKEDPLSLDRETMRRLGYETVDFLVEWLIDVERRPLVNGGSPGEMQRLLSASAPEEGNRLEDILEQIRNDVLERMNQGDHPGYMAFIPANGTWAGALGDFIASACNVYAGSWKDSAGPSQLELVVLDWFARWIGFPPPAGGILLSGGSAANMTALACARENILGSMRDDVTMYLSDQAHSSLPRAARILGFHPYQVRVLPTDQSHRMRPDALRSVMKRDLDKGLRPLFVAASAGSTNTGAVDPLADLARLCTEHGAWFHVDAAYGGFAAITARGRKALSGIEQADSVTLDPHKWLYQPFECGCLMVREGDKLDRAFRIVPDYLEDALGSHAEVDFCDRGFQLTRMCRALKVWTSVRYFGLAAFRDAIDGCLDLALLAQERIAASEELELMHPASLGVVCFRRRPRDMMDEEDIERLNRALLGRVTATGDAFVSSTRLHGRYALRICVLNHTTRPSDVERLLDKLEEEEVQDRHEVLIPDLDARARHPTAGGDHPLSARLAATELFGSLSGDDIESLAGSATVMTARVGDTIVERWGYGRDFFVILEGQVRITIDDEVVRHLGPGNFFGELAALDWGAGFGYTRLASASATRPTELAVVPGEVLNALVKRVPAVEARVRRAVQERIRRS
jgi:aromatic-L-amino-acid decarboxylase